VSGPSVGNDVLPHFRLAPRVEEVAFFSGEKRGEKVYTYIYINIYIYVHPVEISGKNSAARRAQ
jgi:hypothetical protein